MYNGLIFLRKNWQMSSHLLSVQFYNYAVLCHTKIFDSDWVVFTKNIINEVVSHGSNGSWFGQSLFVTVTQLKCRVWTASGVKKKFVSEVLRKYGVRVL